MINAFGGLVILRTIAGNITSYSSEIYGQLKSLHGFFPAIAGNCPRFVFPMTGKYPRLNLGSVVVNVIDCN